jgi:Flp pilus assembly protein TadG
MNKYAPTLSSTPRRSPARKRFHRKATAASECAICLPIVLTLTFTTIEFTSAIFLKESLTIAAYEGARVAVQRKARNVHAVNKVQQLLDARDIKNATITVSPNHIETLNALDVITVTVSAPLVENSFFLGRFLSGQQSTVVVSMRREYDE